MVEGESISWGEALARIAGRAQEVDRRGLWPAENLDDLRAAGVLAWAGGQLTGTITAKELHQRYEELAGACLTTALVLTQRDAAVVFLLGAEPSPLVERLLGELSRGEIFATIGIAQLTTSRQHQGPAVTAAETADGFRLNGVIPWSTGAQFARRIIVGAALEDRRQILVALRNDGTAAGVNVKPPMELPALSGTHTTEVVLRDVAVAREDVLRGSCESALAGRAAIRGFALPTCVLPLGHAGASVKLAEELARTRSEPCRTAVAALEEQHADLARRIYEVGTNPEAFPMHEMSPMLRSEANVLAMHSALAALELAKGAGFLLENPAQRRVREASFFFVWSSPERVIEQTLARLANA